jgi:formylglycine-generating enzyme required for sulfatase activity
MPANTKPLAEIRRDIEDLLVEALPEALKALRELLPEGTDKHQQVLLLVGRLNAANKDKRDGVIDFKEYELRIAAVRRDTLDLVGELQESDFEVPTEGQKPPSNAKEGIILYQIPGKMPLQKPSICRVRVALDEDAVYEDLILTNDTKTKNRVEVSDYMSAELVDIDGNVFEIKALNNAKQNIRAVGYTQWLFQVRPKMAGEHQLLVKVSLLEFDPNTKEYVPRDVSLMETVTIVTEEDTPHEIKEIPEKKAEERVALEPGSRGIDADPIPISPPIYESIKIEQIEKPIDTPIKAPIKTPIPLENQANPWVKPIQMTALFLTFLMASTTFTYAFTPAPIRDWWVASIVDTPEAYSKYIDTHGTEKANNPRVEKAYFYKAKASEKLEDLRAYQKEFGPSGVFENKVVEKIRTLEIQAVESLEKTPELNKIQRFLADFPDATQLPRVKAAVEQLPATQKTETLPVLEQAYIKSMSVDPQPQKFQQYVQDFPKLERLDEMAEVTAKHPVLSAVQTQLDAAIVKKVENEETPERISKVLETLKKYGSLQAIAPITMAIEQKPAKVRGQLKSKLNTATKAIQVRAAEKTQKEREQKEDKIGSTAPQNENPTIGNTKETPAVSGTGGENAAVQPAPAHENTTHAQAPANHPQEAVTPGDLPEYARKSLQMAKIPAGQFTMGDLFDEGGEDEKPTHQVTLSAFEIGKYEVTQELWYATMQERPSSHKNCADCPVEYVSWEEVQIFLQKLNALYPGKNYRLPTEAEWEYAAREGGKKVRFGNGKDVADPAKINFDGSEIYKQSYSLAGFVRGTTVAVGSLRSPNALGLHDMSGNVLEWCSDWYGETYYNKSPAKDPQGPTSGSDRVCRGGSWCSYPQSCRVADRNSFSPGNRDNFLGFRLARTL